jgi:type IV secretory pathway VirB2 component (pilin)
MNLNRTQLLTVSLLLGTAVMLCTSQAFASMIPGVPMAPGGQMPWERVLGMIVGSLTGTTAKLVALLGLAICGYMYITGEGHTSKLLKVGLGIALLVGGGQIVSMFFAGGSGAVI